MAAVTLEAALARFTPQLPLGIALSGGADSTALLLACARKWPGQLVALHINHGLQSAASAFEVHCRSLCGQLAVPLQVLAVAARHAPGQSPEDAARIARYEGLEKLAKLAGLPALRTIALAQHADDQVETLLLALSRGAGVAGLAAMPAEWQRGGLQWARPLLEVSGAQIREWLQSQGQAWVEDPSNASMQYTRNRIRARLLPVLEAEFPQFRETFARSAANAAQADELLQELAAIDLAAIDHAAIDHAAVDFERTGPDSDSGLLLEGLQQLSVLRQANVLRFWLKTRHRVIPSMAQLDELLAQVAAARTRGQQIRIKVGDGFAVRHGDVLAWYNRQDLHNKN